jgi:hypothetical protein
MLAKSFHPWLQTIQLLRVAADTSPNRERHAKPTYARCSHVAPHCVISRNRHENARVFVIERLSPLTAAVQWSDSTRCNYSGQIWRAGVAGRSGDCALSGESIQRGQAIYRPIPLRPAPSNADAMILASKIDLAFKSQETDQQFGNALFRDLRFR